MIISHKYRYLFLETPHTGSTAISSELCRNYAGTPVLHKHAHYFEFKRIANKLEKQFFVFAGIRNPLDDAVSVYLKFLNNHNKNYTKKERLLKSGGHVTLRKLNKFEFVHDANNDFGDFLNKFYRFPYTSYINVNKKYCDYIVRFENLNNDFANALERLGIKQIRPLPQVNKTANKQGYMDFYKKEIAGHAVGVFGPYIQEWGYAFPDAWYGAGINSLDKMKYAILKIARSLYCRYVQTGPLKKARLIREIVE